MKQQLWEIRDLIEHQIDTHGETAQLSHEIGLRSRASGILDVTLNGRDDYELT